MARLHPKEGSRPAQDGLMPFEGATQPAPAFAFAAWVVFLSKAQFGKDPRPQEGTEQAHEAVAQGVTPHHIGQQGLKADADGHDKCKAQNEPQRPAEEAIGGAELHQAVLQPHAQYSAHTHRQGFYAVAGGAGPAPRPQWYRWGNGRPDTPGRSSPAG